MRFLCPLRNTLIRLLNLRSAPIRILALIKTGHTVQFNMHTKYLAHAKPKQLALRFGLRSLIALMVASSVLLITTRSLCATQDVPDVVTPTVSSQATAPLIYRVEAYAGHPFGIGMMRYRMHANEQLIDQTGAVKIREANNRVLYPVFAKPASARFFQRLTGNPTGTPDSMHVIWFLFRGDQPLEISLEGANVANQVVPVEFAREKKFSRMFTQWWRETNTGNKQQLDWADYPPLVDTYLKSMLSHRLGVPLPGERKKNKDPFAETLELIFDMESLRSETIKRGMAGLADIGPADKPMPPDVDWGISNLNGVVLNDADLEPFARCVPEECFYLRFGSWNNQIWLRNLMEEFGGNLGRMINLRGYEAPIESKFLNQLAIRSTEFDRLFGGNLIDDVALVGSDMFFGDGGAIGVMLHAKNTKSLQRNLSNKRKKFAEENKEIGCVTTDIQVDGVSVQFLRTPDNRYRSFYVVRDDCHFVTSSLTLARRFIESAAGTKSMAKNLEFRYARQQMPLSREDTVFVFIPSKLLQNLLGPHYQIELARRNRSITDMQISELAALAAGNEGFDSSKQEVVVSNGFLPINFGERPDGSELSRKEDYWLDSIRGRRGFFAPIPDIEISGVTQSEIDWYEQRRAFLTQNLSQLDPMFIALKRYEHKDNIERIVYDARVAPFGKDKYDWLFSMLGPPITQQIKGSPNDIVSFQASLDGSSVSRRIGEHQIFGAIQDEATTPSIKANSIFRTIDLLRGAPGYVVSWPKAGYVDWIPKLGGRPDSLGFTHSRVLGLWRLQWENFSAVSFDQQRLADLQKHLDVVPAERPAQIRINIGDLAHSNLKDWANAKNYRRSWETSIANTRLLNKMSQQFNLEPEQARKTVEHLLDVELVCSLGGEYELDRFKSRKIWTSTAWPDFANPQLPADYISPLLTWFRGWQLEMVLDESQFVTHGFLDIQRSGNTSLPSFDLFKGFGDLFGGKKKAEK